MALVSLAAVVPAVAIPASASASTVLIGSGSSAAQPYMLALFNAYHKLHKNVTLQVQPGRRQRRRQGRPVRHLRVRRADRGAAAVADARHLHEVLQGCPLHRRQLRNKLSNLSLSQLAGIYKQPPTYTSWSQIGGNLGGASILTEGRNSAAGQFTFFQSAVLNGGAENSSTTQLTSDGLVKIAIEKNKDAIGYVGLANSGVKGETKATGEKALSINGIACSPANVKKQTYPLWRYDWYVLPADQPEPGGAGVPDLGAHEQGGRQGAGTAGAVPAFNK